MNSLRSCLKERPRTASALAFGGITMVASHFSWFPDARMNGLKLTLAVGLAHAVAGAITGRRLLDGIRTKTSMDAGLLGAVTSCLALVMFSPAFALVLARTDARRESVFSHLMLTVLIALFSFMAAWWAFILVSIGVGWTLYRAAD